jgi:hypothetical protein
MADNFTPAVKKLLRSAGCRFEPQGRGAHEIWYSPLSKRRFMVDAKTKSRHKTSRPAESVLNPPAFKPHRMGLMASKFCDAEFTTAMYASLPLHLLFFGHHRLLHLLPDIVLWLPKQVLPQSVGCFQAPGGDGYICP